MSRYAALSRPAARWIDAGVCRRCKFSLWLDGQTGALFSKAIMSSICRRRPRKHEAK